MRGFSEYLINNGNVCLSSISNHILNSQECISGRLSSFVESMFQIKFVLNGKFH